MRSFGLRPVGVPPSTLVRMAELQHIFHKLYAAASRDLDFIHQVFDQMSRRCEWTRHEISAYERVVAAASSKPLLLLPNSVYLRPAGSTSSLVCSCSNVQAGEPYQLSLVQRLQSAEHHGIQAGPLRTVCAALGTAARMVHPGRTCVALLSKPTDRLAMRTRIDLRGVGKTLQDEFDVQNVLYVSMADLARTKLDASGDLVLDEHRISVIYSRFDFSHPWGRWVDPIPPDGGSAPTEEVLAEWRAIQRMEVSNAIISSNLGCRLAHRRAAQHAYVRGGGLDRLLAPEEARALRTVLPHQWALDPDFDDGEEEKEAQALLASNPGAYVAKNMLRPRTGSGITQDRLASGGQIITNPADLMSLARSDARAWYIMFEKVTPVLHGADIAHKGSIVQLAPSEAVSEVATFGCYLEDGHGNIVFDEVAGYGARTRPACSTHSLAGELGYGALCSVQDSTWLEV